MFRYSSSFARVGLALASLATAPHALLAAPPHPSHAEPLPASAGSRLGPAGYYLTLRAADSLYRAKQYARAGEAYAKLLATDTSNVRVWQNAGWCLYRAQRFAEAAGAFSHAVELGGTATFSQPPNNAYNVACCYARLGRRDDAFHWLERSLAMGFTGRDDIRGDEDLASLRDDPRFQALLSPMAPPGQARDGGWRLDLDLLLAEIRRLHAVYRSEPLPAGFDAAARSLRERIPTLSDADIAFGLQGLMARLGDGHSVVMPGSERVPLHALTIGLYLFAEGPTIVSAAPALSRLVGRRVTAIGGRPVSELLATVRPYVSRDNDMGFEWAAPKYLSYAESLKRFGCMADTTGVEVVTEDSQGRREMVRVPFTSEPQAPHFAKLEPPPGVTRPPLYLQHVEDPYWFQALEGGRTLYVQFNQVVDKKAETLPAFGLRLRHELAASPVTDVIVDVRHNNGGNSTLVTELVRTLVAFDATHPGGHLFVITGRGTFSAAQVFINRLESSTGAVFVGEPSSSKPDFVGEDTLVRLPYSGLAASISSRRHFVDGTDTRVWIAPAIPAPPTAADYFAGRDAALDAVMEVVGKRGIGAVE
jgi:hypothetical protein